MKTIAEMRARLGEIADTLGEFQGSELTEEQLNAANELHSEFESLTAQIETQERLASVVARVAAPAAPAAPARKTAPASVTVGKDRIQDDPKRGFKSQGEFYASVISYGKGGQADARFQGTLMERSSEDGGILVPEDFRTDIQTQLQGEESLLPLTTQFRTGSNNIVLPTFDQAPWDSTQGVQAYWVEEGGIIPDSKMKFGSFGMRLHKIAAMVKVTEELMEDAPLLETWIRSQVPKAIVHKINSAIIRGTGAGQPEGFLNSSFKIKVAKEAGQLADTINFANINKMLGALAPQSIGRARWFVNPAILPQLRTMTFSNSGDPIPVFMPSTGVSGAPYGTLFGIPMMPMMGGLKAVGDEGDIVLADMSYYFTATKSSGIKASMSTHVYFDRDINAFKFTQRIAGGTPYKAPITNEAGDYSASGIVTLADRA